ncbi:hypothetical protein AMTRI_Chr01g114090 [Amborella trichopoda]
MGCSTSKVDDEETVQLCKDRKKFIKEAVEQRILFATGHIAYVQAIRRLIDALNNFVELEKESNREILFGSPIPIFTPVKGTPISLSSTPSKPYDGASPVMNYMRSGGTSAVTMELETEPIHEIHFESPIHIFTPVKKSPLSFSPTPSKPDHGTPPVMNYLRSGGGNSAVSMEERPQSPETSRVESYSLGIEGFFSMNSPRNSYYYPSPYSREGYQPYPPQSPAQASPWDFFWDPFSSLDLSSYPSRNSSYSQMLDDETRGFRQVREEEGIPELEDERDNVGVAEEKEISAGKRREEEATADKPFSSENNMASKTEEVSERSNGSKDGGSFPEEAPKEPSPKVETEHQMKGLLSQGTESVGVSEAQNTGEVEVRDGQEEVANEEVPEGVPEFTAFLNHRATCLAELVKEIEHQFLIVCDSANEVSTMLEASRAQYSATANELLAMKMLNPIALIRSASSRSSSSRTFQASSSSRDDMDDSSSDFSEESCMLSGSHQSTLDRLYAWEKKLYDEVKSGARIRIKYEKKCMHLRNHDAKGDDPWAVDKTRTAIRDLHTRIKVSIQSVESVSKRIQTLRDEELEPQLTELIQGLARMWKVMAECHEAQKRAISESKLDHVNPSVSSEPHRRVTNRLESELQNWQTCFSNWVSAQRAYVQALNGWLLRCIRLDPEPSKIPFSPLRYGAPPIFSICRHWANIFEKLQETHVLGSIKACSENMRTLSEQQFEEIKQKKRADTLEMKVRNAYRSESRRMEKLTFSLPDSGHALPEAGALLPESGMERIESFRVQLDEEKRRHRELMEKTAEDTVGALCSGLSVVFEALVEFSGLSAQGYEELEKQAIKAKHLYESGRVRA